MFLDESGGEPALWMPRFDRAWNPGRQHWQLLSVESLAAAIGKRGFLRHEAVLIELQALHSIDPEAFSDPFENLVLECRRMLRPCPLMSQLQVKVFGLRYTFELNLLPRLTQLPMSF